MPKFHQKTKHSYMSVRQNSHYLDWDTQPRNYKKYTNPLKTYSLDDLEDLFDLNLVGGITLKREYPNGEFYLRTVPTAGGLFPFELYIQIRDVDKIDDGIYHYEPHARELCQLHEVNDDGVEYYFKDKKEQKGFTFLISAVYFRSSWKYRDRSIRYILLDAGHQLGAIYAAMCVMGQRFGVNFDFDKLALNDIFNFKEDEMFLVSASSSLKTDKDIRAIETKFAYEKPSDYLQTNQFVFDSYKQSVNYDDEPLSDFSFFDNVSKQDLREAIIYRRSIREFKGFGISGEELECIEDGIYDFAKKYNIDIFYTVHRVGKKQKAIYKNGELQKEGDYRGRSKYLSLEQALGGMSAVTFYFTSDEVEKYQKVYILSGFLAHIIYLRCELEGIGCSGIGAYYDDEAKEFLNTTNNILYLLAIGR
jgi:SagB-type dehydrogenase family enzyme